MSESPRALAVVALIMLCGIGSSATIYVSGNSGLCIHEGSYPAIQDAVDAASDGDEILVCGGEYLENVVVDKSIALRGGEGGPTVIRAAVVSHPVVTISADGVVISDFTLKDATGSFGLYTDASEGDISRIEAANNDIGFYLHSSSRNRLSSNVAHDNIDEGFRLNLNSDDNLLSNNTAYNQLYYGFYLRESSGNRLVSNTAYNSTAWYGFFIYSGARNNELVNNTAFGNLRSGFHIYSNSDNGLRGNSAFNNSGEGFRLSSSSKNSLSGNSAFNNSAEGFRLSSASGNELSGNSAFGNMRDGFLLSSSTKNSLTNNTAYGNSLHGFYLHQSSDNELISNDASREEDGFHVFGGSKNRLEANEAHDNGNGFYLDISSGNSLESNTAYGNEEHGFLLSSCTGNSVEGNEARGNGLYGFYGYLGSENGFTSNAAQGNLDGFVLSASAANSMSLNTAQSNYAYGIYLYQSAENRLDGNIVEDNSLHGIYAYESDESSLSGNMAESNGGNGIYLYLSSDCGLDGNSASSNRLDGISIYSGSGNALADNEVYGNARRGIAIILGSGMSLRDDAIHSNGVGCLVESTVNASLEKVQLYDNGADLEIRATYSSTGLAVSKADFSNPEGGSENRTKMSLEDALQAGTGYSLSWARQPAALPHPHISFEGKYLNITALSGPVSIDSISWHWLEDEAKGRYHEKDFRIWQHDEAGWLIFDALPDVHGKKISLSGLSPGSVYAVLQNRSFPAITLGTPAPGATVNSSANMFGWTVDTSDGSALCDIIINGSKANAMPVNSTSGAPTIFQASLAAERAYLWNVTCRDSVGTNTSETRAFFFDRPPAVRLQNAATTHTNASSYALFFTVNDNVSSVLECTLLLDGSASQTNNSVRRADLASFLLSGFQEGNHSLRIACRDGAGSENDSETKRLVADFSAPSIGLLSPPHGYLGNNTSTSFTFTGSDAQSPPVTYSLYIDGAPAATGPGNLSALLAEGQHNWSVLARDGAGNAAMSETRNLTIDRTPPLVHIDQPAGEREVIPGAPAQAIILFTAVDDDPAISCSLFVDGALNRSGILAESGTQTGLALANLPEGNHTVYISCADHAGNSGVSAQKRIIVDGTAPEVALITPPDGFLGNMSAVDFRFLGTDNQTSVASCSIIVDGAARGNASTGNFTVSLPDGAHNWSVLCSDEAGNNGTSGTRRLTLDQSPPVITSLAPPSGETMHSSLPVQVNFSFTADDDRSDYLSCTLYIDNSAAYADDSIPGGAPQSVSGEVAPGNHHWRLECGDDAGNIAKTSERILIIRTNGSSSDDGENDDSPKPRISISAEETCPDNSVVVEVSSGQGTLLRLIGPEGFELERKTAGSGGQAGFQLYSEGIYEVRASKSSYRSNELVLYHALCPVEIPGEGGGSGSPGAGEAGGREPLAENNSADAQAGPDSTPYPGTAPSVAQPESGARIPDVGIEVPESAHVGEIVTVKVLVDGAPADVALEIQSPAGRASMMTDISGKAKLTITEAGRYTITVSSPGLPRKNATLDATESNSMMEGLTFPLRQNFSICTPLFFLLGLLLLVLILMSAYAASERRKRRKGEYGGYHAKRRGKHRIMEFFGL